MRALTLKQPWCHAVVHHGKTIENRRWRPVDPALLEELKRGFLIHAAKGMTRAYCAAAMTYIADVLGTERFAEFSRDFAERARFGGVVGRARLVDIIPPHRPEVLYPENVDPRWHMKEQHGFVLAGVESLSFTPLKGALSFFNVPNAFAASLEGLS